jgi:hypothetical protein
MAIRFIVVVLCVGALLYGVNYKSSVAAEPQSPSLFLGKQGSERQPSCEASRIFLDLHRFISSLASAFFTSYWEIRNCRAIRDGVKPALKAARIAFSLP